MGDHICPVCGGYGISLREKTLLRLYGRVLICRACGTQLTVDYWQSIVSLVPFLVLLGVGFLLDSAVGLIVCLLVGLVASWLWQIKYVPLVPIGRSSRPK